MELIYGVVAGLVIGTVWGSIESWRRQVRWNHVVRLARMSELINSK
jgi:hypothetical protein